jgi:hypothetical protein
MRFLSLDGFLSNIMLLLSRLDVPVSPDASPHLPVLQMSENKRKERFLLAEGARLVGKRQ